MHIHAPDTGCIVAPQAPDKPEQLHALLKRLRRTAGQRSAILCYPVKTCGILRSLSCKRFGFFRMAQDVLANLIPALRNQFAVFLLLIAQSIAGHACAPNDPGNALLHQELIVERKMQIIPAVILLSPDPRLNHFPNRIRWPGKKTGFGNINLSCPNIFQNTSAYLLY